MTLQNLTVPFTLISSHRLSLYTSWRGSDQSGLFYHQVLPVSPEELTLPRSARCALSHLRCNGHSTLLGIYLHRFGRAETSSCSNCGSESQDLSHLVLDCPVLHHMRRAIFGHSLSIWTSGLIRGESPDYWDSAELIRAPIPRNGSGKPTTTTIIPILKYNRLKTQKFCSNCSVANLTLLLHAAAN